MSLATRPMGRRERNKHDKLERITAAASALLADRSIDEITTQQFADAADIGTGTLFLYVKSKGDLLLLVQNAHYEDALARGREMAARSSDPLEAVVAHLRPIVECNRAHVENGRIYLREMLFGDPDEPPRAAALDIVARTNASIAAVLVGQFAFDAARAQALARIIGAIVYLELSASANETAAVDAIVDGIAHQISAIL